jgi:hypothetical protein
MASFTDVFENLTLNEDRFVSLITDLISVSKQLQNNPAQGLVPNEDLASDFVLKLLAPYSKENGGPLEIEVLFFELSTFLLRSITHDPHFMSPPPYTYMHNIHTQIHSVSPL